MFDGLGSQYPEKERKPKTKPNLKQEREDVKYQKPINNAELTQDMATFYGHENRGQLLDGNKLYQKSKNPQTGKAPGVPSKV